MIGTVRSHRSPASPTPPARLGLALAVSALAHGALISAPLTDLRWRAVEPSPAGVPITVRLARTPETPVIPDEAEKWGQVRFSDSASPAPRQKIKPDPIFPTPDSTYYPSRELDDYPRPLTPLRIDYPPGSAAGEIRLELLIDEHGVVRDVTFSSSTDPGGVHETLRGTLMATVFIPAIKDGRAVRSRIVLGVGYPSASER